MLVIAGYLGSHHVTSSALAPDFFCHSGNNAFLPSTGIGEYPFARSARRRAVMVLVTVR